MAATIVSSVISWAITQADGQRIVSELHTDSLGVQHVHQYQAAAKADITATLAAYAAQLLNSLAADEITSNVNQALTFGSNAVLTFNYSAKTDFVAAVKSLAALTVAQQISLGHYLMAQPGLQLTTQFGFTAQQITVLTNAGNGMTTALSSLSTAMAPVVTATVQ